MCPQDSIKCKYASKQATPTLAPTYCCTPHTSYLESVFIQRGRERGKGDTIKGNARASFECAATVSSSLLLSSLLFFCSSALSNELHTHAQKTYHTRLAATTTSNNKQSCQIDCDKAAAIDEEKEAAKEMKSCLRQMI